MANTVAVGLQWGDEGKGKIVDVLSEQADYVVRFAGGANAGHTIMVEGEKLVLHLLPSGVLRPRCRCALGAGMVIDPEVLLTEIETCRARGVLEGPGRVTVSPRAQVVLPVHKALDRLRESTAQGLGTTLRGIGPAYEDRIGRRGIWIGLLRDEKRLRKRLLPLVERANRQLESSDHGGFRIEELVTDLLVMGEKLAPYCGDVSRLINEAMDCRRNVLFEGAQGALLDVYYGTYPFVTSSSTLAGGACGGVGCGPARIDSVIGVTKCYTTRVGSGPFPTEDESVDGQRLQKAGGEFGATTGRPRRCGWLDLPALRRAVKLNGVTSMALTKLDVLCGFDPIRIAVAYRLGGRRLDLFPADPAEAAVVEPIYETMPGWQGPLNAEQGMDGLPAAARRFVARIEKDLEVPIYLVSVGPERDQTIMTGQVN